jgi:uncharacterized repeat protein (TIGR02543 family)
MKHYIDGGKGGRSKGGDDMSITNKSKATALGFVSVSNLVRGGGGNKSLRLNNKGISTTAIIAIAAVIAVVAGIACYAVFFSPDDNDKDPVDNTVVITLSTSQGISTIASQSGKTIFEPEVSTPSGYTFGGWYRDPSFTVRFNFNEPVYSNIVLYGSFVQIIGNLEKYTITFVTDGSSVPSQTVEYGKTAIEPDSAKSGMTFEGWYTDASYQTKFNFQNKIYGNMTLYAKFVPIYNLTTITVTFITDGSYVQPQTINYGAVATEPQTIKTGYTFNGWYTDQGGQFKFNFSSRLYENITLYAKFTSPLKQMYTVEFYANGVLYKVASVEEGKTVDSFDPPQPSAGYAFAGWFTSSYGGIVFHLAITPVNGNLKLYAHFETIDHANEYPSRDYSVYSQADIVYTNTDTENEVIRVWRVATMNQIPVANVTSSSRTGNDAVNEIAMEWSQTTTISYTSYVSQMFSTTTSSHWEETNQHKTGVEVEVNIKDVVKVKAGYEWTYNKTVGGSVVSQTVDQYSTTLQKEVSQTWKEGYKESVFMKKGHKYQLILVADRVEVFEVHKLNKLTGEVEITYALDISSGKSIVLFFTQTTSTFDLPKLIGDCGIKAPFSGLTTDNLTYKGIGTSQWPYAIRTAAELKDIENKGMDKHYILMNNVTLSGTWKPIGEIGRAHV